jgi:hypothetical protein
MGCYRRGFLAGLAALALAGCSAMPSAPRLPELRFPQPARAAISLEAELLAADRTFNDLAQTKGVGPAFIETVDPTDGMLVRPGALFKGLAAVQSAFLDVPAGARLVWSPDQAFVARSGDIGVTSGRFVSMLDGRELDQGRYVSTWRKDATGRWRLLIDVSTADPRPAPPPPPPATYVLPQVGEAELLSAPPPGAVAAKPQPQAKPRPRPRRR